MMEFTNNYINSIIKFLTEFIKYSCPRRVEKLNIPNDLKNKLIEFIEEVRQECSYKADYCFTGCSCDNLNAKCAVCAAPYYEAMAEAEELLDILTSIGEYDEN